MNEKFQNLLYYAIGVVVLAFFSWRLIGFILPDNPKEQLTATTLLDKVMVAHGGANNWEAIEQLSFNKDVVLYDNQGVVEKKRSDHNRFKANGDNYITYIENNDTVQLTQKGQHYLKFINGTLDTLLTTNKIKNSINASSFVISLPFNLNDQNAKKTYQGIIDFEGKQAHDLKVVFDGSTAIWHLYFDIKTFQNLGYWVKTSDHYSLVITTKSQTIKGFVLPEKRLSYRTDSLKNKTWLRAKYDYYEFGIN